MALLKLFKPVSAVEMVSSLLDEATNELESARGNVVIARDQLRYYESKLTLTEQRVVHLTTELETLKGQQ
jgi:hypothetical protein